MTFEKFIVKILGLIAIASPFIGLLAYYMSDRQTRHSC